MLRGVVFDMDYTLYDRMETDRRAISHFFDTRRNMFSPDCTKEYAVSQMEIASPLNSRKGWGCAAEFLFRAGVLAKPMDGNALGGDFQRYYHAHIVPYPFCNDMLNALTGMGLKIGLITNGDEFYQSGKVRKLGFYDVFPHILIGSDPKTAKPHVDLFLQMADLLEAKPSELVYVGDHPINDVFASASAGYTPIWVRACPWDEAGEPPLNTVPSVEGLDQYIKTHFDVFSSKKSRA